MPLTLILHDIAIFPELLHPDQTSYLLAKASDLCDTQRNRGSFRHKTFHTKMLCSQGRIGRKPLGALFKQLPRNAIHCCTLSYPLAITRTRCTEDGVEMLNPGQEP